MKRKFFRVFLGVVLSFTALILPLHLVFAAIDDLATWAETDPNSRITVESSDNVSWVELTRDEIAHLQHGGSTTEAFHWQVTLNIDTATAESRLAIMGASDGDIPVHNLGAVSYTHLTLPTILLV